MIKKLFIGIFLISIGYLLGFFLTGKEFETIRHMEVMVRILRQDKVLDYLEAGNLEEAKRVQSKFLESSLRELSFVDAPLPKDINEIVVKRKNLIQKSN